MIYILMIWTVVGFAGAGTQYSRDWKTERDWRPLGEFQAEMNGHGFQTGKTAQQMCEDAANQLGIKPDRYRCVRAR